MWYFAYGSNLNYQAVAQWCRHYGHQPPQMRNGQPAVLDNYRLCFPIFSEYWGGGIADIVYDPGKYVAGVMFDLSESDLAVLDQKVGRRLDAGRESGVYKRVEITVSPVASAEKIRAITYQGVQTQRYDIPPNQHYFDLLIEGAYSYGLSMIWISYLRSFSTQAARKPRPPGTGDAAPRL